MTIYKAENDRPCINLLLQSTYHQFFTDQLSSVIDLYLPVINFFTSRYQSVTKFLSTCYQLVTNPSPACNQPVTNPSPACNQPVTSLSPACYQPVTIPQELTYWAEGSPEHHLRRNTLDAIPTLYEDAFNDPGDGWEGSGALGHAVASPGASPGPSPLSSPGQPPLSPGDPAHILHGGSPAASQKESGKGSHDGDSIFSVKGISSRLPFDLPFDCSPLLIGP